MPHALIATVLLVTAFGVVPPATASDPLPDVPWVFPPTQSAEEDQPADQAPFNHLPIRTPKLLWSYMAQVDLTDPAAVQAGARPSMPKPPARPTEPPLDRPAWLEGQILEQFYQDLLAGEDDLADRVSMEIKRADARKDTAAVEALEVMRALATLRAGKSSIARAQFAQQKKAADPKLRAFALAYCEVLRQRPPAPAEDDKQLADWIRFRPAAADLADDWQGRVQRKLDAISRDPTHGSHVILKKSAENLERLKDSVRMLELLQPGQARPLIGLVLQREHDIRLALLKADVRDLEATRETLIAAARQVKPRIEYNGPARQMLEELGGQIDFVPPARVRQHNQLLGQLRQRWAHACRSQHCLAEFLAAAGDQLGRTVSLEDHEALARRIWAAPYVDDLDPVIRDYYSQDRPRGRVFSPLKPAAQLPARPSR